LVSAPVFLSFYLKKYAIPAWLWMMWITHAPPKYLCITWP